MTVPPRRRPLWKRALFCAITFVGVVAIIEFVCYVAICCGISPDIETMRRAQDQLARSGIGPEQSGEMVHPYLGAVANPGSDGVRYAGTTIPINSMGFADTRPAIRKRGPRRVVVGIVGGSVAWQVSVAGEQPFAAALKRSPAFHGKEIVLVRLALNGHKQPQQLMALNYVLALGGEFDYVINIDGFNEVALPWAENIPLGIHYSFPRSWKARALDLVDPERTALAYDVMQTRVTRRRWAQRFCQLPYRNSPTLNLVWNVRDRLLSREFARVSATFFGKGSGPGFLGFEPNPESLETALAKQVALWKRCSIQLQRLCRANGIGYVHVLQPNQYFEGSKPIGEDERRVAVHAGEFRRAVARGYPLLVAEGADLKRRGVNFVDLTQLYSRTPEPIYVDGCCHYNKKGNTMLAEAMAEAVLHTASTTPSR